MTEVDDDEDPPADDRVRVSFEITSEVMSLAQITAVVGLEPDHGWSVGDAHVRPGRYRFILRPLVYTFSRWSLYSRLGSQELEWDHLDDLYDRAAGALERVADLPDDVYRALTIVRYYDARAFQSHGAGYTREWIALLGRIGAEIDRDQYVLQDGPDDDWPWPAESARRRADRRRADSTA